MLWVERDEEQWSIVTEGHFLPFKNFEFQNTTFVTTLRKNKCEAIHFYFGDFPCRLPEHVPNLYPFKMS